MKEFDQNDPVWKLLGHGKTTEASPWFASRVMSNLPKADSKITPFHAFLSRWLPLGAIALIFLAALGAANSSGSDIQVPLQTVVDFEIIQDLDLYIVKLDSNAWTQ
ncbi:MAG: hypothetical protein ACOVMP_02335 [Chthoniobacterales bacterium]